MVEQIENSHKLAKRLVAENAIGLRILYTVAERRSISTFDLQLAIRKTGINMLPFSHALAELIRLEVVEVSDGKTQLSELGREVFQRLESFRSRDSSTQP